MKKIGIFSGYFYPYLGGVERYIDKLSTALEKRGYTIVFITSNHDNLPSYEKIDTRSIYRLPITDTAKNRYPIPKVNKEYRELIAKIEAENIDCFILNTRFHLTSLVGARMAKRQHKVSMLVEHGTGHFTINNIFLDFFGRIYEHLLTIIIKIYVKNFYGVSIACNNWLKHFSIKAKGVFYNAVDLKDKGKAKDIYKDIYSKDEIVVSFAGRLLKEKGILNLLDAFNKVLQDNPGVKLKLVVAGSGDLLSEIQTKYKDPSIEILGKLDFSHIMALYKRSDVFVHPSLYPEGLPTSILEAGLMNCAVIATPRGGTEEVIIDSDHGIITDGSVEDLRRSINLLIKDANQRISLALRLRQRIEGIFNWDVVAKTVDEEIKKISK